MKLEIVMFNMSSYSEWEKGVVNRNYHIFNKLLHHPSVARIIAVDFLPFTLKRAARNCWENIIRSNVKCQMSNVLYRDLTTKCMKIHGYPSELYVFSTIDSVFSHQRVIKKLNKALNKINPVRLNLPVRQAGLTRVVWSYFPMFVSYFDKIKADITVFDTVDNWIEHPSFVQYKDVLAQNYKIISEKSDIIFTVAEPLLDFFKSFGREKNLFWISNGVDIDHFTANTQPTRFDLVGDIKKIPGPIVGYVGTIQHRIDFDLLKYVIDRHSDKSFVFVGPIWKDTAIEKLKKRTNVYFLGRKPYKVIPTYIKSFDLCIIPHKLNTFIKYTYSLKMLDYLASGKPVVSTKTQDVEHFSDYIYIAHDYKDFNNKLDTVLKSDTIEMRKKRIERAKKEDWKLKVNEMIKILSNVL